MLPGANPGKHSKVCIELDPLVATAGIKNVAGETSHCSLREPQQVAVAVDGKRVQL